jgi:hypothetical protein
MTPEEAADIMSAAFELFVDSECGGTCALPGFDPPVNVYRRNPTSGRIEWQLDGEWQEPTGDYAIPDPGARDEQTEALQKCGAASNAAAALKTLYANILSVYDDQVEPLINQTEMAAQVALQWGVMFGPVSESFLAMSGFAWTVFTTALSEVTENDWNEEFEEILVCILNGNSDATDGVVTFDFYNVNNDLVGFILPVIDNHVRVRWQVWYLLQCIGEQGLNLAGAMEDVDGDCVTCDTWCVQLTPAQFGFVPQRAYDYFDAAGWLWAPAAGGQLREAYGTLAVDTTHCEIVRLQMMWNTVAGATTGTAQIDALPSDGPIQKIVINQGQTGFPLLLTTDDNAAWHTNSDSTTIQIYASNNAADTAVSIRQVTIWGTGINPFGIGSNC